MSRIQPAYPPKIQSFALYAATPSTAARKRRTATTSPLTEGTCPSPSIFSQNRSVVEKHPADRQNVQLPALERSRNNIFQEDEANP